MSKELGGVFRWRTMEGDLLTLDEMETSHLFNSLKMIYNHMAKEHNLPTIWFTNQYSDYEYKSKKIPKKLARQMCVFINAIDNRGDLPIKYKEPYAHIITVLQRLGIKQLPKNRSDQPILIIN